MGQDSGERATSPGLFRAVVTNRAIAAMEQGRNGLSVRQNAGVDAAAGSSGTQMTLRSATRARQRSVGIEPTPRPEAREAGPSPQPRTQPVQPLTAPTNPQLQGQSEMATQPDPEDPDAPDDITVMTEMVDVVNLEQPDQPTSQERVPVRTPEQIQQARQRRAEARHARENARPASRASARPQGIRRRPQAPRGSPLANILSQPVAPMLARIKQESDDDAIHWQRHVEVSKRYRNTSAATRRRAEQLIMRLNGHGTLTVADLYNARGLLECQQMIQFDTDHQ